MAATVVDLQATFSGLGDAVAEFVSRYTGSVYAAERFTPGSSVITGYSPPSGATMLLVLPYTTTASTIYAAAANSAGSTDGIPLAPGEPILVGATSSQVMELNDLADTEFIDVVWL